MNQKNEQLTGAYDIVLDDGQPLSPSKLHAVVCQCLGKGCSIETLYGKKVPVYRCNAGAKVLLCKNITYLGNPHPIFKKRIQIPSEWIEMTRQLERDGYDVRFIGVYHYNGFVVFADFLKDTYIQRNCHNSAAHIYTNDLYQGDTMGVFEKEDQNGNIIRTVTRTKFASYLAGTLKAQNNLVELFARFNNGFGFGQWMRAVECIQEMHDKHWSQWKQAEWAGWFLEYKFSLYAQQQDVSPYISYTALSNKGHKTDRYDFDLWFPTENFYGDLKASDVSVTKAPGNDQQTFVDCIKRYGKFWYAIYEHETVKDCTHDYEATRFWNTLLGKGNPMSYAEKMKHSVRFMKMFIIEINRINFHDVLSTFSQGHQPDGSKRNPKFNINKRNIDNYVIYRYTFKQ